MLPNQRGETRDLAPAAPERRFYSPAELAAISGLGVSTIERHIAQGRLRAGKIGRRVIIDINDYRAATGL